MQQATLQRSDARSVLPFEDESSDVYRYIVGASDDETTDEEQDLYEILINKGRLDGKQSHDPVADAVYPWKNRRKSLPEDDLTASCTDSNSWNGSFHDSFATLPGEDPASIQSTLITSIPLSPRRRRRGPLVNGSSHAPAPVLDEDQEQTSSISSQPANRVRLARRRHGSFLDASSTSCCLSEIVEEATEASAVSTEEQQDVAVVLGVEREDETSKVRFGEVEIRYYNVTLDLAGGYGRNGSPVACPLTLDWSFGAETTRKPAVLYGYSSYFRHAKPRPLNVEERRARLGILHHMRLPQVKHWEYKSLLYQMANLRRQTGITDRWNESNCVAVDRFPRMPLPMIHEKNALDYDLHERRGANSMLVTWKRVDSKAPSVLPRGMEKPVVPMQWINHDTCLKADSWEPVPSVWIDLNHRDKPQDTEGILVSEAKEKPRLHRLPSATLLWLSNTNSPYTRRVEDRKADRMDVWPHEASSGTEFLQVPFEEVISSKCNVKSRERLLNSSERVATSLTQASLCDMKQKVGTNWKRAPPVRSNFRVVPFDDIVTAFCLRASEVDDVFDELQESFANMDAETIHFDLAFRRSTEAIPKEETIDWRRNLRSPSTMWWTRNLVKQLAKAPENAVDQKWEPEGMVWLEESNASNDTMDLGNRLSSGTSKVEQCESLNLQSPESPDASLGRCVDAPLDFPTPESQTDTRCNKSADDSHLATCEPLSVESLFRSHPMLWIQTSGSKCS